MARKNKCNFLQLLYWAVTFSNPISKQYLDCVSIVSWTFSDCFHNTFIMLPERSKEFGRTLKIKESPFSCVYYWRAKPLGFSKNYRGPILKIQLTNFRLIYFLGSQAPSPNIAFFNKRNLCEQFLKKELQATYRMSDSKGHTWWFKKTPMAWYE